MLRAYVIRTILVWTLLELLAALQVPSEGGGPMLFSWMRTLVEPVAAVAERSVDLAVDLGVGIVDWDEPQRVAVEGDRSF